MFGQPALFANPVLMNFLSPLLGDELMRLGGVTAVASFPGAEMQHIHRDHQQLFHEFSQIGPALPLYAVNVSIPLIDIDSVTGPTGIWPGSHRWPEQQEATRRWHGQHCPSSAAIAVLMDYRTMHTGMPNNSQTVRPILYLVYTREWFFDDNNHRGRAPLDIPLEQLQLLPPELRHFDDARPATGCRARQARQRLTIACQGPIPYDSTLSDGRVTAGLCESRDSRKVRAPRKDGAG